MPSPQRLSVSHDRTRQAPLGRGVAVLPREQSGRVVMPSLRVPGSEVGERTPRDNTSISLSQGRRPIWVIKRLGRNQGNVGLDLVNGSVPDIVALSGVPYPDQEVGQ